MLDDKTKAKMKARLYPTADQTVFSPTTEALDRYLRPGASILDAGCGKGTWVLRDYRHMTGLYIGLDVSAPQNRNSKSFIVGDLERIPLSDAAFDVVICYNAIEHLRHPKEAFAEFHRVLKSGGALIFKTPCVTSPVFLLSRYLPFRWHQVVKTAVKRTEQSDIFPTFYRCNTLKLLDNNLKSAGFARKTLSSIEQTYDYLTFSRVTYAIGLLAGRTMHSLPWTRPFRSQIIGVYEKS